MIKNIVDVLEDKENLLKTFEQNKGPSKSFTFFDKSELGDIIVVDNEIAKQWLEINYLFSTQFYPQGLPGIGEIGADIREIKEIDGETYLVVGIALIYYAVKALRDFRKSESQILNWKNNKEYYINKTQELTKQIKKLPQDSINLEPFKNMFKDPQASIGWQYIDLPSPEFVKNLEDLETELKNSNTKANKALKIIKELKELKQYSTAIDDLKKIREYHKKVPYIGDEMIRTCSPAASGGLCLHTHPGFDHPYNALPSGGDLLLVGAQAGTLGINIVHIGAGSQEGEHYVMHIPRDEFFEQVKEIVDNKELTDEEETAKIKLEVFEQRLDYIINDQILGFKVNGNNGHRIMQLSPIITKKEFDKHKQYLADNHYGTQELHLKDIIFDTGEGYIIYDNNARDVTMKILGSISKQEQGGEQK